MKQNTFFRIIKGLSFDRNYLILESLALSFAETSQKHVCKKKRLQKRSVISIQRSWILEQRCRSSVCIMYLYNLTHVTGMPQLPQMTDYLPLNYGMSMYYSVMMYFRTWQRMRCNFSSHMEQIFLQTLSISLRISHCSHVCKK